MMGYYGRLVVAVGVILTLVLRRTTFGFNVYAIGANESAAALAGVPVRRTRALLFALSGFFSGLTGILLLGYTEYVFVGAGTSTCSLPLLPWSSVAPRWREAAADMSAPWRER